MSYNPGGQPAGYPGAYASAPAYGGAPAPQGYPQGVVPPPQQYAPQYGQPPQHQYGAPPQQYGAATAPPPQQFAGGAPQPGISPEVMSWFRAVDQDNSGLINASELSRALQSGNSRNFSISACEIMIGMFGASGNINMPQFSQLFAFINQWTEAFKRADADKSGSIAQHELQNVLRSQGFNISPATVGIMVAKYGAAAPPAPAYPGYAPPPQAPPALGLDGFILVNVQLKKLTDAFRQRDTAQQGRINLSYEDFIGMVVTML